MKFGPFNVCEKNAKARADACCGCDCDVSEVRGLLDALNDKSPLGHGHDIADIRGLQDALDNVTAQLNDILDTLKNM